MEPLPPPDPLAEPDGFVVVVEPGDRIHFLDWGGPAPATARRPSHPRPVEHGLVVGAGRTPRCVPSATSSRWTCAAMACPIRRPRATTRTRSPLTSSRSRRGPGCSRRADDRVVLAGHGFGGDRRGLGGGGDGRAVRRTRPRRRRLGRAREDDRGGGRRVPARPRRATRGDAVHGRVPRRPAGVRPDDLGCRPAACRSRPPSSRRMPARSCPPPGRTRSRRASVRCSATTPSALSRASGAGRGDRGRR